MRAGQARVVIAGGGFGGLFTALDLVNVGEVTLISREDHFLFTPMLYEYTSGEVEAWHIAPRYKELLADRVRFIKGLITEVDLAQREIAIEGRVRRLAYDVLILAVGGVTNYADVEGAKEHAIPFRKIEHADSLRRRMIDALDRIPLGSSPQDARRIVTFAVVGAGASGVELATKMSDLLHDAFRRRGLPGDPRVLIIEMGDRMIPGMGGEIREFVEEAIKQAHIEVHTHACVRRISSDGLVFERGGEQTEIQAAGVVWTGGVSVNPLVEKLDVEKEQRGLVIVEPTLQVQGHNEVFALGDIAYYPDVPGPLAGTAQLAYQQAGLVASNVRAMIQGEPLGTRRFIEFGETLSLGTENAAVLTGGHAIGGALARQARFALYTSRLPTWHHRLRVGSSWFFEGTAPLPL